MIRSFIAKAGLGLAASATLAGGLAVPQAASAQSGGYYAHGYQGDRYSQGGYDDCRERKSSNAVAGAIIGGIAGAVLGSNLAGHGVRGEGAALGGVGGAAVGAGIGSSGTDCYASPPPPPARYYDNSYNGRYYDNGYRRDRYYSTPAPAYSGGYDRDRYGGSYASPPPAYSGDYDRDGYRDSYDRDDYPAAPPPPPPPSGDYSYGDDGDY